MKLNETFLAVKLASRKLALMEEKLINEVLNSVADAAIRDKDIILAANSADLQLMNPSDPKFDRLKLTVSRIEDIASDMRNVASLPSPLGKVLYEDVRPNGLKLRKISVPFGVIGVIYEGSSECQFRCVFVMHEKW